MNLFLERLSFLRFGMVAMAAKSLLGLTRTESVLKLFELRSISSSTLRNDRSVGRVQKSFDAIFKT